MLFVRTSLEIGRMFCVLERLPEGIKNPTNPNGRLKKPNFIKLKGGEGGNTLNFGSY